jgi:hypothetical protein
MDTARKQKVVVASLVVLVLGAGSYFLVAGGSKEPTDRQTVVQVPIVRDHTKAPPKPRVNREPRREKPKPAPIAERHRERERDKADVRHRVIGKGKDKPKKKEKKPAA